jgi:membrane-bound ClpP family serine protease
VKARRNKSATGVGGMIGQFGVARSALGPRGTVLFDGAWWDAVSSAPVEEGASVRIARVDGLVLHVDPVTESKKGDPHVA